MAINAAIRKMTSLAVLAIVVSAASLAFAEGGTGGGGGVGFQCGNKVYLADSYSAIYGNANPEIKSRVQKLNKEYMPYSGDYKFLDYGWNFKNLLANLDSYLRDRGQTDVSQQIDGVALRLKFTLVDNIPRTGDDHIPDGAVPCGGQIVQLARQDNDGHVEISKLAQLLSPIEFSLLQLHEVRLRWMIERSVFQGDTTPVRGWIQKFATMNLLDTLSFIDITNGCCTEMLSISGSERRRATQVEIQQDLPYTGLAPQPILTGERDPLNGTYLANVVPVQDAGPLVNRPYYYLNDVCRIRLNVYGFLGEKKVNVGKSFLRKGDRLTVIRTSAHRADVVKELHRINEYGFISTIDDQNQYDEIDAQGKGFVAEILCLKSQLGENPSVPDFEKALDYKVRFIPAPQP